MAIYDRLKVCAVMVALFILAGGLSTVFIQSPAYVAFLFSPLTWWVLSAILFVAAPIIVKVVPVRHESGSEFSPLMVVVFAVAFIVLGIGLLISVVTR